MNRSQWIVEKRKMAERRYDTIFSKDYDEKWGNIVRKILWMSSYFLNIRKGNKELLI